jgi:hypothetical protein
MKKLIVITVVFLSVAVAAHAQENQAPHAQPDSIIKVVPITVGDQQGLIYTIGGKIVTPEDVKIRLLAYAPSALEYGKTKTDLTWSYASFGASAIASTLAVIDYAHNNKMAGETTGFVNGQPAFIYQQHSLTGAYVLTGLATAFLTVAVIELVHAATHGKKAMNTYNQRFE